MTTLCVNTATTYNVTVTRGWDNLPKFDKACVVTDSNVAPLYLEQVQKHTGAQYSFVVPAGEGSKSGEYFFKIHSYLAQNRFSRKDVVIALGGGVVGDLSGFVAATYMRGIKYWQLPTTLLAMIDSSVGGKTAVNLPEGKNLVGAFHQPSGVYINVDTLQTLPQTDLQNGMGEAVKYAFLDSGVQNCFGNIEKLVLRCLKIKANIVAEDEKEGGKRMLLNLGHTVGHAIEGLSKFTIPHGLCVAKGLKVAIDISQKLYGFDDAIRAELDALLDGVGLDTTNPFGKEQILEKILQDKKSQRNFVNFVTVANIGDCRIEKISFERLSQLL